MTKQNSKLYGTALQEELLAYLINDDEKGKLITNLIDPALFEGDYRMFAERAVAYHKQYGEAPKNHMDSLLAKELEDGSARARTLRRVMISLFELNEQSNTEYVMQQLQDFKEQQRQTETVIQAAEALQSGDRDKVRKLFQDGSRSRDDVKFDAGVPLNDLKTFFAMYRQRQQNKFTTGISLLDQHNVVPTDDAVMVLIGSTGKGKSWWLVHLGRCALRLHKRILHVSLELPLDHVLARYHQNLHAIPQSDNYRQIKRATLRTDCRACGGEGEHCEECSSSRLIGFGTHEWEATFSLQSDDAEQRLEKEFAYQHGAANLRVKHFPMNTLTVAALTAYLDQLAAVQGWKPDILLLDAANNMQIDSDNYRLAFGRMVQDLAKLAGERHIAVCTAVQSNREGDKAKRVNINHAGEDWSVAQTADMVLTLSTSEKEEKHGLARLWVAKNRLGGRQSYGLVITQCYDHGQFALEAAPYPPEYEQLLEQLPD